MRVKWNGEENDEIRRKHENQSNIVLNTHLEKLNVIADNVGLAEVVIVVEVD